MKADVSWDGEGVMGERQSVKEKGESERQHVREELGKMNYGNVYGVAHLVWELMCWEAEDGC